MLIQCVLFFGIILGMEYRFFSTIRGAIKKVLNPPQANYRTLSENNGRVTTDNTIGNIARTTDTLTPTHTADDDDVMKEAHRIQTTANQQLMESDLLVLNQVSKLYNGKFRAVDQISVGVPRGECFGLLGVNGA